VRLVDGLKVVDGVAGIVPALSSLASVVAVVTTADAEVSGFLFDAFLFNGSNDGLFGAECCSGIC